MIQYSESFPQQGLHQLLQYEQTSDNVVSFFSKTELNSTDIYAVMLPLGNCPRCEGGIFQFFNDLTKLDSNATKILIAVYSHRNAALNYLNKKNYGVNNIVLIDPDDAFLKNFRFSTIGMQVPYIMKFSSGYLIKSDALLGLDYSKSVAEAYFQTGKDGLKNDKLIRRDSTYLIGVNANKQSNFSICQAKYKRSKNQVKSISSMVLKKYKIDESTFNVSEIQSVAVSSDLGYLAIDDHLTSMCALFEKKDPSYAFRSLLPDTLFNDMQFIDSDVPRIIVNYFKQTNVIHSMYNKTKIIGNRIYISASLPKLFWEDKENEKLAYYNEPTILSREIVSKSGNDWNSLIFNKKEIELASGFSHTNFFFENDLFFFPLKKGWPITGTVDAPPIETENPGCELFYINSPAFFVFNADGSFAGTAGNLPDWHKLHKTGYAFFDPLMRGCKSGKVYVVDRLIGKAYTLNKQTFKFDKEVSLFDINDVNKSLKSKNTASLDYFNEIGAILNYQVIDFIPDNDFIYALINATDFYYVLKTSVKTQKSQCLSVFQKESNSSNLNPFAIILNDDNELFVLGLWREMNKLYLTLLRPF